MSKSFDEKIEEAMQEAKASLELEGFTVAEEDDALVRAVLKGEITHEEFMRLAKMLAEKASSETNKAKDYLSFGHLTGGKVLFF